MFKKQRFPFDADAFLDVYETCNVGCKFCKFNKKTLFPIKSNINFEDFSSKRVLVSYSTEPLPFQDNFHTKWVIENLHKNNASILFLSRFPKRAVEILDVFGDQDIVGVSISEPLKNNFEDIKKFLKLSRQRGLKTWLSVEPLESFEFASFVLDTFKDCADFVRLGKLDDFSDNTKEWQMLKEKLESKYLQKNIFIKD